MTNEEQTTEQTTKQGAPSREAWRQVGDQFKQLGESIAAAFHTAWQDESTQQYKREVEEGLNAMADSLNRAADDLSQSEEAQKIRAEAEKAAQSMRKAGERAAEEAGPWMLKTLKQVSDELEDLIAKLETRAKPPEPPGPPSPPEE